MPAFFFLILESLRELPQPLALYTLQEEAYLISRAFPRGLDTAGLAEALTTGLLQKSEEWLKRTLGPQVGGFGGFFASALSLLRDFAPQPFFFFCTRAKQDRHTSTHVIHQSTVSPMLLFLSLLCPESNVIVSPVSQMMRVSKSANQSGKFRFYLCSQREGGTLKILYKQDQAVGNII